MSSSARPCPKCHSLFIVIKRSFVRGGFYAECEDCGERGTREPTIPEAQFSWNTRAGEKS